MSVANVLAGINLIFIGVLAFQNERLRRENKALTKAIQYARFRIMYKHEREYFEKLVNE